MVMQVSRKSQRTLSLLITTELEVPHCSGAEEPECEVHNKRHSIPTCQEGDGLPHFHAPTGSLLFSAKTTSALFLQDCKILIFMR